MSDAVLAIDWGTTNRRAYRLAGDRIAESVGDDRGVLAVSPGDYPRELAALRERLGALPAIAAGMVGSTRGWREAPYLDAPVDLEGLARGLLRLPEHDLSIVPGVALRTGSRADVMRGEEVQVLGAVAAGLAPADALFCQPGTHNKWVLTDRARIVDVVTVMTGELFALLRGHGILAGMLDGPVADGEAFREGLARGRGAADLTAALFGIRAAVLLGRREPAEAAAHASGLLIGADTGAAPELAGRTVHLLATGPLADLYTVAIGEAGGSVVAVDDRTAFAAGIHRIWELSR